MTTETLAEVLESPRCACGAPKRMQLPFCYACVNALPAASRHFVTANNVTQEAYNAALEHLQKDRHVHQDQA